MKDLGNELIGRRNGGNGCLRNAEFWAVRDVSFEVRRGECLGLLGPNGAGKSTLLRLLNGLIKPDSGTIRLRGRVGAMIALGAGFNPILTGRENIYAAGAILGLSRAEISTKYDSIVEFSELEEFMETPVQSYSSGMQVRLGFSVAAHMEPDILLLDEVLAVGDVPFRAKCFNMIARKLKECAVIFVSHSMPQISRICTSAMVLSNGSVVYAGQEIGEAVSHYYNSSPVARPQFDFSDGRAQIHKVDVESHGEINPNVINYRDPVRLHIYATVDPSIRNPTAAFILTSEDSVEVLSCNSFVDEFTIPNNGNSMKLTVSLDELPLNPGTYSIRVGIQADGFGEVLARRDNVATLNVKGPLKVYAPVLLKGEWSTAYEAEA